MGWGQEELSLLCAHLDALSHFSRPDFGVGGAPSLPPTAAGEFEILSGEEMWKVRTGTVPPRAGMGEALSSQGFLGSTPIPGILLLLAPLLLPGGNGLAPLFVFMALLWTLPILVASVT